MGCYLSYASSITGDCTNTNSGAFTINIDGTAPDYTIQWLSPPNGTIPLGAGVTAYTQTNLSAGTYTFNIIDSCLINTVFPVNIYVSSGTCVSITNIINTVCNSNNGSITSLTSNLYAQSIFYLYNDITGFIIDSETNNNTYTFNNLSSGTYYVIADDGGGCSGKSESVIVKNSSNLSFGLYKVDNAGCAVDSGKIMITDLTGTPPYTYSWSNGGTEDNITGLSDGTYSVTVTDSSNCSVSNTSVINTVQKVGLGAIYLTQPSCFTADGEVEIIITGGTPPFYYLGSNGVTNVTFDRTVIFTGLGPGGFTIQVTDAGLCNFSTSTNLLTPRGMSIVSVGITNSKCNDFSGIIGPINVFGGTPPYTFNLTNSFGNTKTSNPISQSNWLFDGLSSDTYNLTITDNGGCTFTSAYTINNEVLFGLTVSTTGTTCNGNNGSVYAQITSGGTPPYIYEINGSIITTSLTSYTFNNLTSGNYTLSVTDVSLCKQSKLFNIGTSTTVDFQLLKVDSQNNDGSISVYITNGQPPFTLYWTGDVGGQTGTTVTNLTPGNYSVRVVDNNGCSKTMSITIDGNTNYNSTGYYTVCSSSRFDQPITILSGPKQILNEGYNELILRSDNTNCILTAATFQALVYVGAFSASSVFYTSTGLLDYPSDELWYDTIQSLLESSPQVGDVNINSQTNTIVITTNCEESSLVNANVIVKMRIEYDIECACPTTTPTPTPTPTQPTTLYNFCMNIQIFDVSSDYVHFNPNGVDSNGKNKWISDDTVYQIVWSTLLNKWELQTWPCFGSICPIITSTASYPPLTDWTISELSGTVTVTEGPCVSTTLTPTPTMTPTPTNGCNITNPLVLSQGTTAEEACTRFSNPDNTATYYTINGVNFANAVFLNLTNICTQPASSGWYSDGDISREYNSSTGNFNSPVPCV